MSTPEVHCKACGAPTTRPRQTEMGLICFRCWSRAVDVWRKVWGIK